MKEKRREDEEGEARTEEGIGGKHGEKIKKEKNKDGNEKMKRNRRIRGGKWIVSERR